MNIEIDNTIVPESDPRRKKFIGHIARDIKFKLRSLQEEDSERKAGLELYSQTLEQMKERFRSLMPDHQEEIDLMFSSIVSINFDDVESFGDYAAETLVDFILKYFDYQQIEEFSRQDRNMLNRLVEYVVDNDGEAVRLHIPLTLVNGIELRTLFIEALKELAKKMQEDQSLQKIKRIDASSWIIYRTKDKVLEAFGFTNIERDDSDQTGSAELSREVLLEKYGKD